jgi:N-acetylgalactosamine-N,N'-diacetylbacillosaminyl-diphospho-undecaprenol 4-alpha-N-acetylgalactosaminyltransferase
VSVDLALADAAGPVLNELHPAIVLHDLQVGRTARAVLPLARLISAREPDKLMSALDHGNVCAALALKVAGRPCGHVVCQRSMMSSAGFTRHPVSRLLWKSALAFTMNRAERVIGNSEAVVADARQYLCLPLHRARVIPNGINIDRINQLSAHAIDSDHASWLGSCPFVLAVGRLEPIKNLLRFVDDCSIFGRDILPFKVVVLGDGSQRAEIEKRVAAVGLTARFRFVGFDINPFRWMARSFALVHPSLAEGCPNVVLQALALGRPVVGLHSNLAMRELRGCVPSGIHLVGNDPGELAQQLCKLIEQGHAPAHLAPSGVSGLKAMALRYFDEIFS